MTQAKPNKHQMKTKETREKLLRAAEEIFVRDGYAGADMAEVASRAGRTTGAIYAHFKNKEEIFLALFEESLDRKQKAVASVLAASAPKAQKREMWRNLFIEISKDRVWSLLLLEFKLFAVRHADAQNRLRTRMRQTFGAAPSSPVRNILEDIENESAIPQRVFAIRMMQPLLSAITLEAQLFPEEFDDDTVKHFLLRVFDSVI